ncbi:MAG: hypothetical protein Ct9H300mP3_03280 [Gammaproteobacteria bacterium]|nr:MAG: hypothetical protein Ct9H300mP3_03280 [Gammaproteobacteria bacterium]
MERVVARDSGSCSIAKRGGVVESIDASRIVVRVNEKEINPGDSAVDIYNIIKKYKIQSDYLHKSKTCSY